jgi:hypothetical protein
MLRHSIIGWKSCDGGQRAIVTILSLADHWRNI